MGSFVCQIYTVCILAIITKLNKQYYEGS